MSTQVLLSYVSHSWEDRNSQGCKENDLGALLWKTPLGFMTSLIVSFQWYLSEHLNQYHFPEYILTGKILARWICSPCPCSHARPPRAEQSHVLSWVMQTFEKSLCQPTPTVKLCLLFGLWWDSQQKCSPCWLPGEAPAHTLQRICSSEVGTREPSLHGDLPQLTETWGVD